MKKLLVGILTTSLVFGFPAYGRDYTEEYIEHVIDPCLLGLAREAEVDGLEPEQLARLYKFRMRDRIESMARSANDLFEDHTLFEDRMTAYEFLLLDCLDYP